jgi:hypothetical protein
MNSTGEIEAVIRLESFLYDFYGKVADLAGKTPEQVMADALAKFAADAAQRAHWVRLLP